MQNQFQVTPFFFERYSAELEQVTEPGWALNRPTLPTEGDVQHRLRVVHQPIAAFAAETAARGERPVVVAGDCCAAIPVMAGLRRAGIHPILVWLDAHGDFNTWETSPSGFLGGMPLAMLVGRGEQTLMESVDQPPFPEDQIVLSDGRDLDPLEKEALLSSKITTVNQVEELLSLPQLKDRPLYVHFDTDLTNPDDAPAMSYRSEGGPSAQELKAVFQALADGGQVVAASLSAWNPRLDADGRSRDVCMDLLKTLVSR